MYILKHLETVTHLCSNMNKSGSILLELARPHDGIAIKSM